MTSERLRQELWSRYSFRIFEAWLTELAESVANLAREQKVELQFASKSMWEAFCLHVARDRPPEDEKRHEEYLMPLCDAVLEDHQFDSIVIKLLGSCAVECAKDFHRASWKWQPPLPTWKEWAKQTICARLIDLAREAAMSSGEYPYMSYTEKDLHEVTLCLRSLIQLAREGRELQGIGQALEAMERFERGQQADVNVDVGCYIQNAERLIAYMHIREDCISLSTSQTFYDPGVGSDHESKDFEFPSQSWREIFDRLRADPAARLTVEFPFE